MQGYRPDRRRRTAHLRRRMRSIQIVVEATTGKALLCAPRRGLGKRMLPVGTRATLGSSFDDWQRTARNALPKLIEALALNGVVVAFDAMNTQKAVRPR